MRKDIENELKKYEGMEVKLVNKSELARRMGCSRQTIKSKIDKLNSSNEIVNRQYNSKLDEFKDIIQTKVEKYACSAKSIYLLLKNKYGYMGSYSLIARYVAKFKKEEQIKITIRFETVPGYQSQVDWKEKLTLLDKYGNEHTVNIFLMILGYSRMKFVKATFDRTQKTLFECMTSAFEFFGGTTEEILFDNMKTVVDHVKSDFSNVVINEKFVEFAKDCNFRVRACRAFRPETKGKVEVLAKIMNRLKAYNNEFSNQYELFEIVDSMNIELNHEVVQGINQKPIKRFEKEKNTLSSVNIEILKPYFIIQKEYKVSKESMITYKGKKYSVPTAYVGKYVTVTVYIKIEI
jgi:transposase